MDKVTVKFKIKDDEYDTEKGRWCTIFKWVITQGIKRDMLLISAAPGKMIILLNFTESTRLFIREETRCVACIFISITTSIRKGVKRWTYLSTIGQFHGTFGELWRQKKKRRNKVKWAKRQSNSNWTSRQWLGHVNSWEKTSSMQLQTSSQLTIKWVVSTHHEYQNIWHTNNRWHLPITLCFEIPLFLWGRNWHCPIFQVLMMWRYIFTMHLWDTWRS